MKIYLFDIDGTLTQPRQKMSSEHVLVFLSWMTNKNVYLVTGSDYPKVKQQLPYSIIRKCNGTFCSMANQFIQNNKIIYENKWEPTQSLKDDLNFLYIISAFESTSDVVLAHLKKNHNLYDMHHVLDICRDANLFIKPTWIPFTPWMDYSDYVKMINFIVENDLVGVMMPFDQKFDPIYNTIKSACEETKLKCLRADDFWENSTIIQDIFELIYKSVIILVDLTGKNSNVLYEMGIAHTLGRVVIPISQNTTDISFDIKHHRTLQYYPNTEGLNNLKKDLIKKLLIERDKIFSSGN